MKTTVLKRKALVLSMAMAFIGAMTLTQCKKEPPIVTSTEDPTETPTDTVTTPEGEIVHITLRVNQSNDEKLDVDPPHVYFEIDDVLHVVSNGVHVGVVTYNGSVFEGNISEATPNRPLDFYLLGNMNVNNPNITWTGEGDVKTGCSVNISTQTSSLPVISYAPSNENFTAGAEVQDFTAILRNKCALVKFDVIPTTLTSNIILSGVKNVVTVNFNPDNENEEERFTYSQSQGGGSITVGKREDGYWAILLPQEAISGIENNVSSEVSSSNNYSATVSLPTIQANAYLNTGIIVDFTKNGTVPLYSIGVSANPNEGGSVSGSGDYLNGQSCTVTATPDEDYMFINWTENNVVVVDNEGDPVPASYTFTVNGNRNLVANFGLKRTISVSANPTEGGTVYIGTVGTTSAICPQGTNCTVTATPADMFINWTENGTEVSTDAEYTFTISAADRNLVANFSSSGKGHR